MPLYNFTIEELCKSQVADEHGIENIPSSKEEMNLWVLIDSILQPIRDEFGPIKINSGFRNKQLNALVGGSPHSAHLYGTAADIEAVEPIPLGTIANWIALNLEFDQVILEYPPNGWIHVSYWEHKENRQEMLLKNKQSFFLMEPEKFLEYV